MAEALLFNIAESLLKNLGSRALADIASAWGFKSELEKLTNKINIIKDVLLDAEERQLESQAIRRWLEQLKATVYRADDLFDELATVALQREDMGGNNFTKEVRTFFSRSNQITLAFSISQEMKTIRQDLDDIVKDMNEFGFLIRPYEERGLLPKRKHETYSFLDAEEIIGRDDDKKAILDVLLAKSTQGHNVSVLPIVGIGGLGKTTLAQIIYNDDQVKEHFDLRLWVCVSETFDMTEIVQKILMSATKTEPQKLGMDQLQNQLQAKIIGKKYLLVLDDVWNDNREKWLKLSALLKMGGEGSKILVTTRLREVAKLMGTTPPYTLEGLSDEESWILFRMMAFENGQEHKSLEVLKAAKEIVKKCANVPLAIRTLGSLLYGKDESRWLYFMDRSVAEISEDGNDIMSILKLSYHHLWSPLKNCFAYCALFPKGYWMSRCELIVLWMAQGFIIPMHKQSMEDAAEEYFSTLLQRCFFQDVEKDEWGVVIGCKMHDLMHDLAQEVARTQCKVANSEERDFDSKIHHLSFDHHLTSFREVVHSLQNLKLLRTFLLPCQIRDGRIINYLICNKLLSSFRCLRVLDLHNLGIKSLSSSIGNLIHLRYLDLSYTLIETLPDSITELKNLQTLDVFACYWLKTLPKDISRLTNLRYLRNDKCFRLIHMPSGIGTLTSLHVLQRLPVNKRHSSGFRSKPSTAQLSDLENLNNLRGLLRINILGVVKDPMYEAEKANLSSKHGLVKLVIEKDEWWDVDCSEHDEVVLEGLRPHPNLKKLKIAEFQSQKLPSWAVNNNLCSFLPNLVKIKLYCCKCQQVPAFSQLAFLKCLRISLLENVEYMESDLCKATPSPEETLFFPCLQQLELSYMDNLKGWWKEVGEVASDDQKEWQQHQSGRSFSNLSKLHIEGCPDLKSIPLCPNVEELTLIKVNKTLSLLKTLQSVAPTKSLPFAGCSSKLKYLRISTMEDLISLPKNCLHYLLRLTIEDPNLQSTSRFEDIFTSLSSVRRLIFNCCNSLTSISAGFKHLTALEILAIRSCPELDLSTNEGGEEGMPWKALTNLRSLMLIEIPKLVALPDGLQGLTNLQHLVIRNNQELKEIPQWISCLSSLQKMELRDCPKLNSLPEGIRELTSMERLEVIACPGLTKRCTSPTGKDWPKIQHIPIVIVTNEPLDIEEH